MKGGRRIDDHSSWVGSAPKGEVFPRGPAKAKSYSEGGHDGHLDKYEDTSESIKAMQDMNMRKAKAHSQKSDYRN